MLKNKEFGKLLLIELLLFLFAFGIGTSFYKFSDSKYKKEFVKNNGYMISAILNTHPELEEEVIDAILSGKGDFKEGKNILKKYGLDDSGTLDYLEHFHNLGLELLFITIILILVLFLIFSIPYWIFIYLHYKKLKYLGEYMDQILNDNYTLDIKDYEEGTFSTLKNDIYKLTIKLKEGRDQSLHDKKELEQILSDISHQIRTPLTSMYVINDLLTKDEIDSKMKVQFLEKNRTQLERIEWLVTSLLKMSRLDSGSVQLKIKETSIKDVIDASLEPLEIPMELKNIIVEYDGQLDIKVAIDFNWTVEVFVNVLKNAYVHTKSGGKITITVFTNPLYTEVAIHDTGCGIKKEELPHIFERFYTGSGNKESIGIGLNMARKVMEKQNGEIYATSTEEGTTFFLKFYKNMI